MNDRAFLLSVLADGQEHELTEIIGRSQAQRGFGMTVHSRAADLRPILAREGKTIIQRSERHNGRVRSYYRLASLERPDASSTTVVDGLTSGPSNELSLFDPPRPRERFAA